MPQLLYPRRMKPWYPVNKKLGWLQSRPEHGAEENNSCPYRELNDYFSFAHRPRNSGYSALTGYARTLIKKTWPAAAVYR